MFFSTFASLFNRIKTLVCCKKRAQGLYFARYFDAHMCWL